MPHQGFRRTLSTVLPAAVCAVLPAGCNSWQQMRGSGPVAAAPRVASAAPSAAELVAYLNANAQKLQSLECRDLQLDATQRLQSIGLTGNLVCQKPKNFRMSARVGGNTMVDLGSNQQEFWYWIAKAEPPYLFHCSYQEFAQGRARMPFPFQPEWIMEALGMAEYDPAKPYQVVAQPTTFELVEQTVTRQGQPVRKVTVFNRSPQQVQVAAHLLLDAQGKEVCSAHVTEVQQDRATGAVYPYRIKLVWPAEHITLKMKLDEVAVNSPLDADRQGRLFTRPVLRDVQTYDLARGPDAVPTSSQVRRAGGFLRP